MAMKIAWKDTLAPLTNANARLTFLMVFVAVLWLLPDQTRGDWLEGLKTAQKAILSFLIALPAFVLLNAFCAFFTANKEIRASGLWFEHRFVYNDPLRVLTVLADDKDNDKTHVFKVDDAEIGSLVEILIESDSPLDRVKAQIVWPKGQNLIDWGGVHKNIRTRLSLPKDKLLGFENLCDSRIISCGNSRLCGFLGNQQALIAASKKCPRSPGCCIGTGARSRWKVPIRW